MKSKNTLHNKNWRSRNPDKYKAHQIVQNALRNKSLVKLPCIICGEIKVQAHHEDYTKPLEIIWFCHKHHVEHHYKKEVKPKRVKKDKNAEKVYNNILIPEAIKLREQGLTYSKIAKKLNYSASQIFRWINNVH